MVRLLFDSNILIDYLNGVAAAKDEMTRYADRAISMVTWIEVMVGATRETERDLMAFLARFERLPIDATVSARAVVLRQSYKIKLPDAIIWATAQVDSRIFVTRNTKDFPVDAPDIRVPYRL